MTLLIEAFRAQQARRHVFNATQNQLIWDYPHVANRTTIQEIRSARKENAEAIEDIMEHFQKAGVN